MFFQEPAESWEDEPVESWEDIEAPEQPVPAKVRFIIAYKARIQKSLFFGVEGEGTK